MEALLMIGLTDLTNLNGLKISFEFDQACLPLI